MRRKHPLREVELPPTEYLGQRLTVWREPSGSNYDVWTLKWGRIERVWALGQDAEALQWPAIIRYLAFLEREGIVGDGSGKYSWCLCAVLGKRRCVGCPDPCTSYVSWSDHTRVFRTEGSPVWISEPYGPEDRDDLDKLRAWCDRHGLVVEVSAARSWHYPGKTALIVVKAGAA